MLHVSGQDIWLLCVKVMLGSSSLDELHARALGVRGNNILVVPANFEVHVTPGLIRHWQLQNGLNLAIGLGTSCGPIRQDCSHTTVRVLHVSLIFFCPEADPFDSRSRLGSVRQWWVHKCLALYFGQLLLVGW